MFTSGPNIIRHVDIHISGINANLHGRSSPALNTLIERIVACIYSYAIIVDVAIMACSRFIVVDHELLFARCFQLGGYAWYFRFNFVGICFVCWFCLYSCLFEKIKGNIKYIKQEMKVHT